MTYARRNRFWLAAALAACTGAATAQTFPQKTVRIVVPFSPGSTADVLSRSIGQKLTEAWQQQIVVESRTGAGGGIAAEHVARSAPDGYTLLMGGASTLGTNALIYKKLPYDPVRDFAPVIQVVRSPSAVLVHPTLPVKSVKDLIALAKARPGALSYSSSGNGTPGHLAVELMKQTTGTDMVHIPYRGANEAIGDLFSGQVQFTINSLFSSMPHIQSGRVRAIATTGVQRSPELASVPTVAESGLPGYQMYTWFGLVVPAGTPQDVITKLNREVGRVIELPDVRQRFMAQGAEVTGGTQEQFGSFIKSELERWRKVVAKLDLKAE